MAQDMPQDQAQWLFEQGATLVFLDVPEGTEFGVDCNSWNVGPQFRGVKMIPPGIHFIYYSAVNTALSEVAPRTGFFHNFRQREVLIKKWDKVTEDIDVNAITSEEQERIESNKKELDQHLGPYPYDSYKKWISLTNHVSSKLIERLVPLRDGKILSVSELESTPSDSASRKKAMEKMDTDGPNTDREPPIMKEVAGTEIRFTPIPKEKYPVGSSPTQITKYSMDYSYCLETLIKNTCLGDSMELLGEVQFAFVCFLFGQVFDGFEQWKKLVHLLCNCEEAIVKHTELYSNFISLLHFHVQEIPPDFFVDIVTADNFFVSSMRVFFENLAECGCCETLAQRGEKFKRHLEKKYKWDLSVECEENAPVVVD